jgi:hypothetical protein
MAVVVEDGEFYVEVQFVVGVLFDQEARTVLEQEIVDLLLRDGEVVGGEGGLAVGDQVVGEFGGVVLR